MPTHDRVLFIAAMDRELAALLARLDAQPTTALPGGYRFWTARLGAVEVGVVQTHVGAINAASACTAALLQFAPACVLKLGCVGGHGPGVHAGDVVEPLAFFHSGAWITRDEANQPCTDPSRWQSLFGPLPYQVNDDNLGGRGPLYSPDAELTARFAAALRASSRAPVRAYIGSSAMWFFEHRFMQHVLAAQVSDAITPAWAADMESYAIAQVCAAHSTPFTGLYRVSNSEYYDEPYDPAAVATLFAGEFIDTVVAFVQSFDR
jgi:nucleoside phosphorylase